RYPRSHHRYEHPSVHHPPALHRLSDGGPNDSCALASAHAVRQAIIRSATGRPRGPRSFLRIPALRRPVSSIRRLRGWNC
ncbi:hypothetical protein PENTCL1PPCAC_30083, partial [Pristionchus entomophagus]